MDGDQQQAVYKCREEAKERNTGKRGISEVSQAASNAEIKALRDLVSAQGQTVSMLLSEMRAFREGSHDKRARGEADGSTMQGVIVPSNNSSLTRQSLLTDRT